MVNCISYNQGSAISSYSQVLGIRELNLCGAILGILPAKGVKINFLSRWISKWLSSLPPQQSSATFVIIQKTDSSMCKSYWTLLSHWFICSSLCQFHSFLIYSCFTILVLMAGSENHLALFSFKMVLLNWLFAFPYTFKNKFIMFHKKISAGILNGYTLSQ